MLHRGWLVVMWYKFGCSGVWCFRCTQHAWVYGNGRSAIFSAYGGYEVCTWLSPQKNYCLTRLWLFVADGTDDEVYERIMAVSLCCWFRSDKKSCGVTAWASCRLHARCICANAGRASTFGSCQRSAWTLAHVLAMMTRKC